MSSKGKFYYIGIVFSSKGNVYVADICMMVSYIVEGIRLLFIYVCCVVELLVDYIEGGIDFWFMFGINFFIKEGFNSWGLDINCLFFMDCCDFNKFGIGLDDLVDVYI